MIEFTVEQAEDGLLLDRVMLKRHPDLSRSSIYKALRKKDIRINGKRITQNMLLSIGMQVVAYISLPKAPVYQIMYENDWIMLCNKPQGLLTQPDGKQERSLIDQICENAGQEAYALCHRLDRNTGGLIFVSKQPAFTEAIAACLNSRYYQKIYRAVLLGDVRKILAKKENFVLFKAHHFKDSRGKRVYIYNAPRTGTKPIETAIRFVSYDGVRDVSEVEVQLITGRTHQIRAHLAFLGFPVAGDGKYGVETRNRLLGYHYQALWAYCYKPADDYAGARRIHDIAIEDILPKQTFTCLPDFH